MKEKLLNRLRCADCGGEFALQDEREESGEIKEGNLVCLQCDMTYPIVNFIPRLVGSDNYAQGFGFQWNIHARTQVDRYNGTHITRDRFYSCTGWNTEDLSGETIFEVGCGSGRFTQIMLDAGMEVYSLDYSRAVDACLANHGLHPNLNLVQGSIYNVPFEEESFDRVFCYGVMQHTPDVKETFNCLSALVKPGGWLTVDVYPKNWKALSHYPRYVMRPLTKHLPSSVLYKGVNIAVKLLLPISIGLKKVPFWGRYLYALIPVANYWGSLPLSRDALEEWAVLDTFDWLGSWYDQPQTAATLKSWFAECGLVDYEVSLMGSLVGTGKKPIG